jgi:tRNA (mo5U34)-methyltransferase
MDLAKLHLAKERIWFYRFTLPDGTTTQTDVPEGILEIHTTRARRLGRIVAEKIVNPGGMTAIDFASHEGFFSIELAKRFRSVRGYEVRSESLAAARLMTDVLGFGNVEYVQADLQKATFDPAAQADFVLVFGLIYHMENPIHVLRLASQLCRQHILVESQIFPYAISGKLEDGSYDNLRPVNGVFALCPDYPAGREGGSTELALVPSLNALLFLLRNFGFSEVEVLAPEPDDYEQFRRGSRVMIYGRKPSGA